jgi:DNA-binding CsgD family transcriptional regulator
MKSKLGRPPKPDRDRKTNTLRIRLTPEQRKCLERVAKGNVSTWARGVLLEAIGR